MTGRITLTDVADAAGVDVSLVSRVLRGKEVKIRAETRERIVAHARALGYRPNAIARSLKSARAGAFGLVIPNFHNPVYAQIIAGAEEQAAQLGSVLMTTSGASWDKALWYDALDGGRVDGLLIAGGSSIDLSEIRVPYLLVNRAVSGSSRYVVLDDGRAVTMAVRHLVELGHSNLGFVAGPADADTAVRRRAGFESAVNAHAVRGQIFPGDYTAGGSRAAVGQALAARDTPTGIVAANLPMAIGALEALRDAGIRVPEQISVVAVHDDEIAGFMVPKLTTVRMPLREMGGKAIEAIATLGAGSAITEVVSEPMELVVRESSGPVSGHLRAD